MGAVDFSIDMRLVESLRRVLPISVFVETGTFEGEAVARARESFEEIHSVELSDHYYAQATERFAGDARVTLYHGDSSHVLNALRPKLEDKAVLYWLDAHWCVADEVAGGESQCPLLNELTALRSLNAESVVLIDDARLFLATPPYPHESSHWPRLQEVLERLLGLSPDHELMVVNDVIVFFPGAALTAVSNHAKSYGTDWLAQLHQLAVLEQVRDQLEAVAAERLAAIEELARERDLQAATASERLAVIEELTRERAAAEERLAMLNRLHRKAETDPPTAGDPVPAADIGEA